MGLAMRAAPRVDSEHVLLLKGLLLSAVVAFLFLAAWHYGLLRHVWRDDTTGLSCSITILFLIAAAQGGWHLARISRCLNHLQRLEDAIIAKAQDAPSPPGAVADYVARLATMARLGGKRRIDQSLLLDAFEADLRSGQGFGWLVADLLLSLGLLGTVIGFVLMLAPISSLDAADDTAIRGALTAITGGMAVALYTTLAGLIGGMLLKLLGYLLDHAAAEVRRRLTCLTEVYVLPALAREPSHASA